MISTSSQLQQTSLDRPKCPKLPDHDFEAPRVFMMDLLSAVPYYTGHLCSALKSIPGIEIEVGAITYHLDRQYFTRENLKLHPGVLDAVSKIPESCPAFLRRVLKFIEYLVNLFALLARFQVRKPEIIHAQFLPLLSLGIPLEIWFLRIAAKMGVKSVYTVHNVIPHENGQRHRKRYEALYRTADHLICHDTTAKAELVRMFGVEQRKISVIPHGPLFAGRKLGVLEARRRLGLRASEQVVLWQGILRRYKGVPLLLDAWKRLRDQNGTAGAKLLIVGSAAPELANEIHDQIGRLQIADSVETRFRFVAVDELAAFYSAADIIVYPYNAVTTSGALMTGLQFGRAVVASRVPAFEQLLKDGEDALLFEPENVEELTSVLARLLGDTDLRNRIGARGASRSEKVSSWPEIAERTVACYVGVLAAAGDKPNTVESSSRGVLERRKVM